MFVDGIISVKICQPRERGDIMKKKIILILIAALIISSSTLYYFWFNTEYTITFETNEGTELLSLTFQADDTIVLPDNPTKDNYEFSGWYSDEELNSYFSYDKMPRENITLYADWGSENLLYVLIENEYTVSKGSSTGGNLIIPKRHDGLLVTRIGVNGFSNFMSMSSITIPNTIKSIEGRAFMMTSLTSIYIPNSVQTIGDYAFAMSTYLTEITFQENSQLTEIGSYAFISSSLVKSLEIPKSVTHIREYAFASLGSMSSLSFEEGSLLVEIETYAFAISYSLKEVILPEGLLTIGEAAFLNNPNLLNVFIPDTVTSIGSYAFGGANYLSAVYIPTSVVTMGAHVFSGSIYTQMVIYCGAMSKPSTWDEYWMDGGCIVEWGMAETPSE